jgi:carbonyl reductase 1
MARAIAVVTGANRGLGLETCRQLAARGLDVVLTARDEGKARAAAATLAPAGRVEGRALDVADAASVSGFAERLAREGVVVDTLVNNAAVSLDGFDADQARATLATNYFGAARVSDALGPLVPRGGRVVFVSSGMGELSVLRSQELRARLLSPALDRAALDELAQDFVAAVAAGRHRAAGWPSNAYSVSKVLVNALVRVLAPAARARGVLVNAVCPGWVRTDMGGASAPRSVQQGAAGIVWAATLPADGPNGGFFRDGRAIDW